MDGFLSKYLWKAILRNIYSKLKYLKTKKRSTQQSQANIYQSVTRNKLKNVKYTQMEAILTFCHLYFTIHMTQLLWNQSQLPHLDQRCYR